MSHVAVTLRLNTAQKILEPTPATPVVHPGDTIAWTCPDGAITVSFDTNDAFESSSKFQAAKGSRTDKGKIRADVPLGQHFECHVTFNGKPMRVSYGFDTSGSGG
jgi:plastocyanin